MDIINPFEELVVFGKKLPLEPTSSTVIRALRPTGRHVSHANALTHVRGRADGGPATRLEHYTTTPKGLREGPFSGSVSQPKTKLLEVKGSGKGFRTGPFKKSLATTLGSRTLVGRGVLKPVKIASKVPAGPSASLKPTRSIGALPIGKGMRRNSNIPSGARRGGRL